MATYVVRLPVQTARLNELLGHWRKSARIKKRDRDTVAIACRSAYLPLALGKRRVSLEVVLGPRQRGADPDAWQKSLADAMVACGALVDDNRQGVEWAPVTYSRGPQRGMILTLEDVD